MKSGYPLPIRLSLFWVFFILLFPSAAKADSAHTVQPGESLFRIAKRYQVTVPQLQGANGLMDGRIYPGQRLLIPAAPAKSGSSPVVKDAPQPRSWPTGTEGPWQRDELAPDTIQDEGFLLNGREGENLIRVASGFLGLKYIRGGSTSGGVDCSAFVQRVFRLIGIDLPRTVREQFQVGYKVARETLEVGDLVFFKRAKAPRPTHVGIYLGDGRFIHASLRKQRVHIDHLDTRYFAARFIGAKRLEEVKRLPEPEALMPHPALPGE